LRRGRKGEKATEQNVSETGKREGSRERKEFLRSDPRSTGTASPFFSSSSIKEKKKDMKKEKDMKITAEKNWVREITLEWLSPLIWKGFYTPIQPADLYDIPHGMEAKRLQEFFHNNKSLIRILIDMSTLSLFLMASLKILGVTCSVWLIPSFTAQIITYFQGGDLSLLLLKFPIMGFVLKDGLALCLGLVLIQILQLLGK
jgi:hypothetical protein